MKLLKIIFIITICINFPIFAENLESVTTTEDIENDVFIPLDENHPILNPNDNINDSSEFKNYTNGKIIALNNITATSEEIDLKVGEEKYFCNIKIKLHKCIKNLDPYNEDNYLLMTITEYKIDEDPNLLFQGWMISSSISLSTFEHPIYEIFAKDCF
ncbi:MAG: DUF2155 domain-containing protein [Rickettsia africae]|uniref:DUF2155 domain-containing protein n=1 Tax=Rickettsia africae (strain ESF-5) TaxID=347255 RepID=C3PN74_RICAE|nr:DUF2155 domain-containing protein [Rickettsia africae]ACP53384.1 Unknown [Rickettsia africae ESF-5]